MTGSLKEAETAVLKAKADLDQASNKVAGLDPTNDSKVVAAAEVAYRNAVLNSQVHSFTGMVFGKDSTEVSDGEVNTFLRIFVFVPAILVSLCSTFLAMTSVVRIKKQIDVEVSGDRLTKQGVVEVPDEGLIILFKATHDEIVKIAINEVIENVSAELSKGQGAPTKTGASKGDPKSAPDPTDEVVTPLKRKEPV